jgi:hypothetical protein
MPAQPSQPRAPVSWYDLHTPARWRRIGLYDRPVTLIRQASLAPFASTAEASHPSTRNRQEESTIDVL